MNIKGIGRSSASITDYKYYNKDGTVRTGWYSIQPPDLDETFSELDAARRGELMRLLDECEQGIVTTTDLKAFSLEFLSGRTIWEVRDGILLKEGTG